MPEALSVSSIDGMEKLKTSLAELFDKERYQKITQAIGMYSILIDPVHMLADQRQLYGMVLTMIKNRIRNGKAKHYAAWLTAFPKLMAELAAAKQTVTDKAAADVVADYHDAYGPFKSVDEFFFWALTDRRLSLAQIVKYIHKTAELHERNSKS